METLFATQKLDKNKFTETFLKNSEGVEVAHFPSHLKQPHKNQKTITINCFKYKLIFK